MRIDMMHPHIIPFIFGWLYNRFLEKHSFSITVGSEFDDFYSTYLTTVRLRTILSISKESVLKTNYSSCWTGNFRISSDDRTARMLLPRTDQIVGHKEVKTLGSRLTTILASVGGKEPPLVAKAYQRRIRICLACN